MSDETKETEAQLDLPPFLFIHSMVRRVATRTTRAKQPTRAKFKQFILANERRLIRSRPLKVPTEKVLQHLPELKLKNSAGILEVRTPDGRHLNLEDLTLAAARLPQPSPNRRLDSVAYDTPTGYHFAPSPGGSSIDDPAANRLAEAMASEKKEEAEKREAPASIPPVAEPVVEAQLENLLASAEPEAELTEEAFDPAAERTEEEVMGEGSQEKSQEEDRRGKRRNRR